VLTACVSLAVMTAASPERPAPAESVFTVRQDIIGPNITAPASAHLGSAQPGASTSVQLGTVQVSTTDVNSWSATVSASNFTTGTGTAAETIDRGQVSYWSGPVVTKTGLGTYTPGQPTEADAVSLNTARTAFSYEGISLLSTVTWKPTVTVSVPPTAVAGDYTGTITHSAA
jgi:hypothetical protein